MPQFSGMQKFHVVSEDMGAVIIEFDMGTKNKGIYRHSCSSSATACKYRQAPIDYVVFVCFCFAYALTGRGYFLFQFCQKRENAAR